MAVKNKYENHVNREVTMYTENHIWWGDNSGDDHLLAAPRLTEEPLGASYLIEEEPPAAPSLSDEEPFPASHLIEEEPPGAPCLSDEEPFAARCLSDKESQLHKVYLPQSSGGQQVRQTVHQNT